MCCSIKIIVQTIYKDLKAELQITLDEKLPIESLRFMNKYCVGLTVLEYALKKYLCTVEDKYLTKKSPRNIKRCKLIV